MIPVLVALTAGVIGLLIGVATLERRNPVLRARQQAYKFHELRDRLQILVVQGKLDTKSIAYIFLMSSLNLAIRNAGVMSLSQILELARAVKRKADDVSFEQIVRDIQQHGEDIRKLYDDFFKALTIMLVSNDHLTSLMFTLAKFAGKEFNRVAVRAITSAGRVLFPERTEAVYEARQYQRWCRRVHALSYS